MTLGHTQNYFHIHIHIHSLKITIPISDSEVQIGKISNGEKDA